MTATPVAPASAPPQPTHTVTQPLTGRLAEILTEVRMQQQLVDLATARIAALQQEVLDIVAARPGVYGQGDDRIEVKRPSRTLDEAAFLAALGDRAAPFLAPRLDRDAAKRAHRELYERHMLPGGSAPSVQFPKPK